MRTIARSPRSVHPSEKPVRSGPARRARTWRPSRLPWGARRPALLASSGRHKPPTEPPTTERQGAPPVPPDGAPPAPLAPAAPAPLVIDRETAMAAMKFYPAILGWARRFGVPAGDAPDVAIEVVLRAVRRWDAFVLGPDEHPTAARRIWLFVIAYRAAATWRKRAARVEPHDPADMEALAAQGDQYPSPEEATLDQEGKRVAKQELDAVRPETDSENWRAFVSHEVEGVPVAVIASLEGVAVSTVYTRLRLARRHLQAAIQRLRARVAFTQTTAKRRGKR